MLMLIGELVIRDISIDLLIVSNMFRLMDFEQSYFILLIKRVSLMLTWRVLNILNLNIKGWHGPGMILLEFLQHAFGVTSDHHPLMSRHSFDHSQRDMC